MTIFDALCGVSVDGVPTLVYTVTPFDASQSLVLRVDPAAVIEVPTLVALEGHGLVSEPAPYADGMVLVVRTTLGAVTVELLDVTGGATPEVLATIDWPRTVVQ